MEKGTYYFDLHKEGRNIIKVIGVGGGGSNAVNYMYAQGIRDVNFMVCNTDAQALKASPVPQKMQIGEDLTHGLGVGGNPQKGKEAALESEEDITKALEGVRMVFVTAGMGGGTGTGAAPEIARISKNLDILTVGIVTMPFVFEGSCKMRRAEEGVKLMKAHCDTVLVVLNEKLKDIYGSATLNEAFSRADNVLMAAAKGIAEIITESGRVNVDFEDVNTVMRGAGEAVMGSGAASGEGRALRAIEQALNSPLLNNQHVQGANFILLSITTGGESELQMEELSIITDYVKSKVGDDPEVIWGDSMDEALGDALGVMLIATGFSQAKTLFKGDIEEKRVVGLGEVIQNEAEEPPIDFSFQSEAPEHLSQWEGTEKRTIPQSPLFDTEDGFEVKKNPKDLAQDAKLDELEGASIPLESKYLLVEEREKRESEMQNNQQIGKWNQETLENAWKQPAYLRRGVQLEKVTTSAQKNLSRFFIGVNGDDMQKNSFLHDNVD